MISQDTICAIATPPGSGALGIIRVSGEMSIKICSAILSKNISDKDSHSLLFCNVINGSEIIDEVLVSVFRNPHAYTGEDSVEISCHGSAYILQKVIELLINSGARIAEPGEFTMRAFMNGKLDLLQAEAVADLIASQNKASHNVAINQMRGGFSHLLTDLRNQLLQFTSLIELELDFSEEDVEFADRKKLVALINNIVTSCEGLITSFKLGNAIKNGVPVAIVGKPNTGKSTLLNALLHEDKAIVSEIPGTTRDVIEDVMNIEGIQVRFIDTAGIRETKDTIEVLGIEKTFEKIKKALVILFIVDATENFEDIHEQLIKLELSNDQSLAVVINKIDKVDESDLSKKIYFLSDLPYKLVLISAKHKNNLDKINEFILHSVNYSNAANNDIIVTNIRHYNALERIVESGRKATNNIEINISTDLISEDVREMLRNIGEITGEITTDEVLGNIFKNFCIGK